MAKGWNCVKHIDLHMLICLEHILSNMHTEANVKDLNLKEPLALKLKTGALPANRPLLFIPESEGRPMPCFTASDCLNRCRVQTPGYHKDKGKRSGLRANGFCEEQRLCVFLLLAGGGNVLQTSQPQHRHLRFTVGAGTVTSITGAPSS